MSSAQNDSPAESLQDLQAAFEAEIAQAQNQSLLDPAFRRRKLIRYGIRTLIALILYIVFWKYTWVRWTLIAYVPLNLFGLGAILLGPRILSKKIETTREKLKELEEVMGGKDA